NGFLPELSAIPTEVAKRAKLMFLNYPNNPTGATASLGFFQDAVRFARKKAAEKYRYPDDRLAIEDLLQRWNLGLGTTLAERRMALRLAREESLLDPDHTQDSPATETPWTAEDDNSDGGDTDQNTEPQTGDDDEDDDGDGDDDFYVGAFQDA
ncbi:MAG: hypothetical protein WCI74_16650, partial [Actinomycetes bacterium]